MDKKSVKLAQDALQLQANILYHNRIARGLSLRAFARAVGTSVASTERWESGQVSISPDRYTRIVTVLQLDRDTALQFRRAASYARSVAYRNHGGARHTKRAAQKAL